MKITNILALGALAGALGLAPIQAETVYAITDSNQLLSFDAGAPGMVSPLLSISGLQINEKLLGIDFRPRTGQLYGLGSTNRLYMIDRFSAAATQVGGVFSTPLVGSSFGIDFNPVPDRLRVISNANQNLRINPITGAVAVTDPDVQYAAGDINFGQEPNIVGAAYANSVPFPSSTQLFTLDSQWDTMNRNGPSPTFQNMTTIATLPILTSDQVGFDISGGSGIAYISVSPTKWTEFYSVNLMTGKTTSRGMIGSGLRITDISVAPVPEPATMAVAGLSLLGLALLRRRAA